MTKTKFRIFDKKTKFRIFDKKTFRLFDEKINPNFFREIFSGNFSGKYFILLYVLQFILAKKSGFLIEFYFKGDDFAIVASDTRLTDGGYGILSRTQPKLFNLTGNICLGATGCWADVLTLTRLMGVRIKMFKYTHNNTIQTKECAQMLSTMLYAKRFFPYSVTNILVSPESKSVKKIVNFFCFKGWIEFRRQGCHLRVRPRGLH